MQFCILILLRIFFFYVKVSFLFFFIICNNIIGFMFEGIQYFIVVVIGFLKYSLLILQVGLFVYLEYLYNYDVFLFCFYKERVYCI